jgi:hypothetical protein
LKIGWLELWLTDIERWTAELGLVAEMEKGKKVSIAVGWLPFIGNVEAVGWGPLLD